MKILVIGGSGFIGSRLIEVLAEQGNHVAILDSKAPRSRSPLPFYSGDITNRNSLNKVLTDFEPELVVHLAALHYIPYCNTHWIETIRVNVAGTMNIISALNNLSSPKTRLIFASSASVYGLSKKFTESSLVLPSNIYGLTKIVGELAVKYLLRREWTICRFFNVYGPGDEIPHLIPSIIKSMNTSDTIILGNVKNRRDYIFIDDLCSAIGSIIESTESHNRTFNIGTETTYSAEDIIECLRSLSGRNLTIKQSSLRRRFLDPFILKSCSESLTALGWRPRHNLLEGLSATLPYYKK